MKIFHTLLLFLFTFGALTHAGYPEGKAIFEKKCTSCHSDFIPPKILKENFFKKNNTILNMKAPSVNMLAYALIDSPTHIGDKNDPEMQEMEIEEFLKDYLFDPNPENTICDPNFMKYYETKTSLKGKVTEEEILHLTQFFMQYKKMRLKAHPKVEKKLTDSYSAEQLMADAQKEDKIIIIEASTEDCHFCKKMKKEVINTKEIQALLQKDFILIEVDVDKTKLPFDLKKIYKGITPSFFFLNKEGKLLNDFPGSWNKKDFSMILTEHAKQKGK